MEEQNNQQKESKKKRTGMAAIAYILFFVPLFTSAKNDSFVKFHIRQGLIIFTASFISMIVSRIFIIGGILAGLMNIAIFILFIMGVINALKGREKKLPFVGHFGDKFNF